MMRPLRWIVLLCVAGLSSACSLNEAQRQKLLQQSPPWYAEAGIVVNVKTEPTLNAWKGLANSVSLLILQARDQHSLNALVASEKAARALFSGAALPPQILAIDRFTALPGQQATLHVNRVENARYVAVIAGYYPVPGAQQAAVVAVPVEIKRGWLGWKVSIETLRFSTLWGERALVKLEGATNLLPTSSDRQEYGQ